MIDGYSHAYTPEVQAFAPREYDFLKGVLNAAPNPATIVSVLLFAQRVPKDMKLPERKARTLAIMEMVQKAARDYVDAEIEKAKGEGDGDAPHAARAIADIEAAQNTLARDLPGWNPILNNMIPQGGVN